MGSEEVRAGREFRQAAVDAVQVIGAVDAPLRPIDEVGPMPRVANGHRHSGEHKVTGSGSVA
jgi:hypothetical protein